MSEKLKITIISPEKVLYEGNIDGATIPGSVAPFAVLPGHVNTVSKLDPGKLSIIVDGQESNYLIDGGFVEVRDNVITALIDGAIEPSAINFEKEQEALNSYFNKIITPEERDFVENQVQLHRFRMVNSIKK